MAKKINNEKPTIALNKKARHDYQLEERFEAGLVLEGWEVKSLRAGRVNLTDSYVLIRKNEAWVIGMHITPLNTVSTHKVADPTRTRKLLLHAKEIKKLIGASQREGYTIVPTCLYWKKNHVKLEVAFAKGKKHHDKRETEKRREWDRQKQRLTKTRQQ